MTDKLIGQEVELNGKVGKIVESLGGGVYRVEMADGSTSKYKRPVVREATKVVVMPRQMGAKAAPGDDVILASGARARLRSECTALGLYTYGASDGTVHVMTREQIAVLPVALGAFTYEPQAVAAWAEHDARVRAGVDETLASWRGTPEVKAEREREGAEVMAAANRAAYDANVQSRVRALIKR